MTVEQPAGVLQRCGFLTQHGQTCHAAVCNMLSNHMASCNLRACAEC